jgi:hypothetical protein
MYFRLKCACGKEICVPEGAAGVALACPCGQRVLVPDLSELRARAASGEIGCTLYADGEERPPRPNPVIEASHGALCWLVLIVGGLIASVGVLFRIRFGGIGYIIMGLGIALMGFAARALAQKQYLRTTRAQERQDFARLTGAAHRRLGGSTDNPTETSVTDR